MTAQDRLISILDQSNLKFWPEELHWSLELVVELVSKPRAVCCGLALW